MKWILIAVLAVGLYGSAMAGLMGPVDENGVRVLDEAMTPEEKAFKYQPHRDAGHEALGAKEFDRAAKEFEAAANATAFAWVRARMLANAGFALARASRCKEAWQLYRLAHGVWMHAEEVGSGGAKWSKQRDQTKRDIEWGLYESACAEKKGK